MFKKTALSLLVLVCFLGVSEVFAEDVYYYSKITADGFAQDEFPAKWEGTGRNWKLQQFLQPYATIDGEAEAYTFRSNGQTRWQQGITYSRNLNNTLVAVKCDTSKILTGKLFVPAGDFKSMEIVRFKIAPAEDQLAAERDFLLAKRQHYRKLLDLDAAGAAWLRYQLDEVKKQLEKLSKTVYDPGSDNGRGNRRFRRVNRDSDFSRTYDLFTGGKAISENLQLDRALQNISAEPREYDITNFAGIEIEEIDWEPLVKDLSPQRDPLSAVLPFDQYAIFFPSFRAMQNVIDECKSNGTPILRQIEPISEDAKTHERYEKQLCLSLDEWSRLFGPSVISSVAMTGSDPYLRTGSDVAIIFKASSPMLLWMNLSSKHKAALKDNKGAEKVTGEIAGVKYSGVKTDDRKICSYKAQLGDVVVVSNSLHQLGQVIKTHKKKIKNIAELDEFTFFRDRYKLGDSEESAFLVLTDATIRKWGSAKWRIGASRRIRAAAVMNRLQCEYMEQLAKGEKIDSSDAEVVDKFAKGLSNISIDSNGVKSDVYGTLGFLTPIAELEIDKASKSEVDAYNRFKNRYQRSWRQFFDPIGVKLTVADKKLATDITVRPLIAASEYRQIMSIVGDSEIDPYAGDRHVGTAAQAIIALDHDSQMFKMADNFARMFAPSLNVSLVSWLGQWATIYVDDDPFWDDALKVAKLGDNKFENFLEENIDRLPLAVHIDVDNPFKLSGFMVAFRAFAEQTIPSMTMWESVEYNGRAYVKVSPSAAAREEMDELENLAIYYAVTPKALVVTLSKTVIEKSLDRMTAKAGTKTPSEVGDKWLGKSLNARVSNNGLMVLRALYNMDDNRESQAKARSWSNALVLNEWKKIGVASPVDFHLKWWQSELVCPGGGEYVWNEKFQTMESTAYGHPGEPKNNNTNKSILANIESIDFGITFEDDGLRAKVKLQRK